MLSNPNEEEHSSRADRESSPKFRNWGVTNTGASSFVETCLTFTKQESSAENHYSRPTELYLFGKTSGDSVTVGEATVFVGIPHTVAKKKVRNNVVRAIIQPDARVCLWIDFRKRRDMVMRSIFFCSRGVFYN